MVDMTTPIHIPITAVISVEQARGANLVHFLNLIAYSEGASYNTIVTGISGPETFSDFSRHPFETRPPQVVRRDPLLTSTAAGRYQLLLRYWKVYKEQLHLPDFSPLSQDLVALQQIHERRATDLIREGKIEDAIRACSNIWASFPNNNYGQGGKSMEQLLQKYAELERGT